MKIKAGVHFLRQRKPKIIEVQPGAIWNFPMFGPVICSFRGHGAKRNKTRTSKVGAISKAQEAQHNFFEKKLEFFEKILSEIVAQCRKM